MTDGEQQCCVLQVISGDIDGIIHRQSLLLRGVRVLVLFVLFVFTKERCSVHILLHTLSYLDKKNTLVIHFCEYRKRGVLDL